MYSTIRAAILAIVLLSPAGVFAQSCPSGALCEPFSTFTNSAAGVTGPQPTDRIPYVQGPATKYVGSWVVANDAALTALPTATSLAVTRLGFTVAGDAPPQVFQKQIGTCAANGHVNDGGSCRDTTSGDGNSWLASPQTAWDIRWWGLSGEPTFYVNNVSGNGNAANFCVAVSTPCASISQAVATALKFDLANTGAIVSIANTGTTYIASIAINGPARGQVSNAQFTSAAALPLITFVGTGSPAPVVINDPAYCYTFLVNNGAMAALGGNITVQGTNNGCASDLYAQFGGTWFITGPSVTLQNASANFFIGEEAGALLVTPGCNSLCDGYLTLSGNTGNAINVTADSYFDADSAINLAGVSVGRLIWSTAGSLFKSFAESGVFIGTLSAGIRFDAETNSTVQLYFAPTWPAASTLGIIDSGGKYFDPTVAGTQACIGGTAGCNVATAVSGLGAGSAVSSGSLGTFAGAIELKPGAGASSIGLVYLGFPYFFIDGICTWNLSPGTGGWQAGATPVAGGLQTSAPPPSVNVGWNNNSVPLTPGSTYFLTYICSPEG
jgi:hypothetical protein